MNLYTRIFIIVKHTIFITLSTFLYASSEYLDLLTDLKNNESCSPSTLPTNKDVDQTRSIQQKPILTSLIKPNTKILQEDEQNQQSNIWLLNESTEQEIRKTFNTLKAQIQADTAHFADCMRQTETNIQKKRAYRYKMATTATPLLAASLLTATSHIMEQIGYQNRMGGGAAMAAGWIIPAVFGGLLGIYVIREIDRALHYEERTACKILKNDIEKKMKKQNEAIAAFKENILANTEQQTQKQLNSSLEQYKKLTDIITKAHDNFALAKSKLDAIDPTLKDLKGLHAKTKEELIKICMCIQVVMKLTEKLTQQQEQALQNPAFDPRLDNIAYALYHAYEDEEEHKATTPPASPKQSNNSYQQPAQNSQLNISGLEQTEQPTNSTEFQKQFKKIKKRTWTNFISWPTSIFAGTK